MSDGLLRALAADDGHADAPVVHLLGHPRVSLGGRELRLADRGLRLLSFVALNEGVIDRRLAASTLWPDDDDVHAAANLRTALWRVNTAGTHLVDATRTSLRLAPGVQVDTRLLGGWAARVISRTSSPRDLCHGCWDLCRLDLLPGWYDDWIVDERERLRQRLLHALEVTAGSLLTSGRCAEAVDVALLVVRADPLRESAHEVLIGAYLAEGNREQAFRAFGRLRTTLRRELGVEPSTRLVHRLRSERCEAALG
ncbi:AfsR/SARP family transcriptional regulator [Ornithinimicrobium kibberense]|uniref:BTAD domain-containing putative transcriptional regulator n=1 Tax=Ornithinimicrobium kibberense TaxID=282060 RepID=A0ABV5V642_9MICO|nr:BTAD domain-containing putative transcriptional regulator [Ornithinimicrobium kibberense]